MSLVEEINPYNGDSRGKGEQVRAMFDAIAPAYDFMNRAMTLGVDRVWRRKTVAEVASAHPRAVLDVATGTGDLAIALARAIPGVHVSGMDLSLEMMSVGRDKVAKAGLEGRVSFQEGDCLDLPFDSGVFDAVTVAYGVRNFADIPRGYREMYRVLRPGGMLAALELSVPTGAVVRPLYNLYTGTLIPFAGKIVSRDMRAYSYLPESIAAVPQGSDMLEIMRHAGFTGTRLRRFTFGTCTLYMGVK